MGFESETLAPTTDVIAAMRANPVSGAERGSTATAPRVVVFEGDAPRFTDLTAALLRSRLMVYAALVAVILAAALLGGVVKGESLLANAFRASVLSLVVLCFFYLRALQGRPLWKLRLVELVIIGVLAMQLLLMMASRLTHFASRNDAVTVAACVHIYLAAWCVVILGYATFIPNFWPRALAMTLAMACAPYVLIAYLRSQNGVLDSLMAQQNWQSPIPLPAAAAVIATWGTHIISTIRKRAFRAEQLGKYRLVRKLGAGGMGEVYEAEHQMLKRPCAIKLIKLDQQIDQAAQARFEREVTATAQLTHWNSVEIFDYGHTNDGTFYYVMELLAGKSFEDLVAENGPLPAARVVYLLDQVCAGLSEAHRKGIVHRDIKPANLFASERGGVYDVVKILDFGLVKVVANGQLGKPSDEAACGSPHFMAPEQAMRYDAVDGRADIYSIGATAYYLLTGRPPFEGRSIGELVRAHQSTPPKPLNQIVFVPNDLEQIVLRCLEKDRAKRYLDVDQLRDALRNCRAFADWSESKSREWWQSQEIASLSAPPTSHAAPTTSDQQLPLEATRAI